MSDGSPHQTHSLLKFHTDEKTKKYKRYMKCMWDVIIQHLINILWWGIQLFSLNTPHQYKTILNQSQPKNMKIHVTFISCLSVTEPLSNQIIRTQTFGFSYRGLTYVHLIWDKKEIPEKKTLLFGLFILFIHGLFNDTVNSSVYIHSNFIMTAAWWIWTDVTGRSCGIIWGTTLHLPEETGENHEMCLSGQPASLWYEIWTWDLLNMK